MFTAAERFMQTAISGLEFPANYKGNAKRLCVMDVQSSMIDLIICLEMSPDKKWEKRWTRLCLLKKWFPADYTPAIAARAEAAMAIIRRLPPSPEAEKSGASMRELRKLVGEQKASAGEIVFAKPALGTTFVQPVTATFNDVCKDVINKSGTLYDLMTALAALSYKQLLTTGPEDLSALEEELLTRSKLVFKGGASIGKFLFVANRKLWVSMSPSERDEVYDIFIKKGDNDTSLMFDLQGMVVGGVDVSMAAAEDHLQVVERVNAAIGSLLGRLQDRILNMVDEFRVGGMVDSYAKLAAGTKFEFAGGEFELEGRETTSFDIVEKDDRHFKLSFRDRPKSGLFGTTSYVQFIDARQLTTKFYLARMKLAFKATLCGGAPLSVNCYGECLDISAMCVDSAKGNDPTYQPIEMEFLQNEIQFGWEENFDLYVAKVRGACVVDEMDDDFVLVECEH